MSENNKDQLYWEVFVECSTGMEEILTLYLFEEGALGIEEISRSSGDVELKVYFAGSHEKPEKTIQEVADKLDGEGTQIRLKSGEKMEVQNWQSNWKEHFHTIHIGENFVVRPPWEEASPAKKEIVIHPGFGFGTGYHESTNLALQLLEWLAQQTALGDVIDVGAGSGILTIGASLLGANRLTAIDIETESDEEIRNNFDLSGLGEVQVDIKIGEPTILNEGADVVLANIEDHILIRIFDDLNRLTKPSGHLLLSGILTERKKELLDVFNPQFELIKEQEMVEWTAMVLKKRPPAD